ncbi:MAG: response regulator transcription factor [Pseudonocardiaceae bacterium]
MSSERKLVAQGLRNREIAARLFVSERTVESHVDHILTKLGLSSRTQVVAWAGDLGLHPSATAGVPEE